jgi:hypothetical protein
VPAAWHGTYVEFSSAKVKAITGSIEKDVAGQRCPAREQGGDMSIQRCYLVLPFLLLTGGCILIPLPFAPAGSNDSPLIGRVGSAGSSKPVRPGVHRDAIHALAGHPHYLDERGVTEVYSYAEDYGAWWSWIYFAPCHGPRASIDPMFHFSHNVCIKYRADGVAESIRDFNNDQFYDEQERRRKQGNELIWFHDLQKARERTTTGTSPSTVPVNEQLPEGPANHTGIRQQDHEAGDLDCR